MIDWALHIAPCSFRAKVVRQFIYHISCVSIKKKWVCKNRKESKETRSKKCQIKRKKEKMKHHLPYISQEARKLDEHLVGGAFGANLVAHQINCNRASALLVLVQHELVVFARNILVLQLTSWLHESHLSLRVCVSYLLRLTCFCFVIIVVLYLP